MFTLARVAVDESLDGGGGFAIVLGSASTLHCPPGAPILTLMTSLMGAEHRRAASLPRRPNGTDAKINPMTKVAVRMTTRP
ncbi:hypothetical protein [Sorangium sp. So ce887]|uniref:hypothetical protein n=1 Tax=Sorangium sp. So ce887 TaxID=3133324 RepID=UPI003F6226D5